MNEKVFLLGLGTQKAGTSWLQAYLAAHSTVDFGPLKEYHTFNALHLPSYAHVLERRDPRPWHQGMRFLRYLWQHRAMPRGEATRRDLRRDNRYFDFFAKILNRRGVYLTGDMTPDYAGLSREILTNIRSGFERYDVSVRAIFLMRDPVERCVSAVRMYRGRPHWSHQLPISSSSSVNEILGQLYATRHFEDLTRYDRTLAEIEAVFPESHVLIGFYEHLFQTSEISRIENFLGLPIGSPDFEKRVNASRFKDETIDDSLRARIANHYQPVFEDAFRRFGESQIRAIWPSAALLD